MSTRGNVRRPSRRRSGIIGAAVLVAVTIGLLLTLGAASGRSTALHGSGDAAAARAAMSSTHVLSRASGHASYVSRASMQHSAARSSSSSSRSHGTTTTDSSAARLLASTGCGAPNTIADTTGFEDNDGNLTVQGGNCTDWNSFAPPAWTGAAPYQTYTTTNGPFQFYGRTDAVNSGTDTSFASGAAGKESVNCPATDTGQITPKDDLARIYVAGEATNGGDTYLYLAWVRAPQSTPNSDLHVAFEFNQSTTPCANGDGLVPRTDGDLLIGYEFQSATPTLTLSIWNNGAWGNPTTLTSANSEGEVWTTAGTTSDLLKPLGAANPGQDEFGEAGLNLTQILKGQLGGAGGGKACETFGNVYGASRTSGQSSTANMEDLVGPQPINLSNCATPTVLTTLHNAANNNVIKNNTSVELGTSVYDSAAFDPATLIPGKTPTGSVSYTFFTNGTCTGAGTPAGGGALNAGVAPNSNPTGALGPGSYSFRAQYSAGNDPNYVDSGPSACEPFTVSQGTSKTDTTVFDAQTKAAWTGTETTGAKAYDTASVAPSNGFATPTGTVTYTFFTNGNCTGGGTPAGTVTLKANGDVPNSNTTALLAAGSYSFQATYSGDTNYVGSTGPCEPFTVAQGTSATTTIVYDGNLPWSGLEVTGASATDTAAVTPSSAGITATGTVSYTFFANGTCTGNGTPAGTVNLDAKGFVPPSNTEGPLAAGNYSFQATYSGDANYAGSTGTCEPFTVDKASSGTDTTVFDAATNAAWTNTETTGAKAYDTSTVTGTPGFTPTGTVTYKFFTNGSCQGAPSTTETVTLAGGKVPNSSITSALANGSYSYLTSYSGDGNYAGSTAQCEPLSVGVAPTTTATVVNDATTNLPWAGTEKVGASAYDTATVTGQAGITPTGTVEYTFFANGNCQGNGTPAGTEPLDANGNVPNSQTESTLAAGAYSFQATYSGDANYSTSTGACEPFTVAKGTSTTDTVVFDAATKAAWAGTETTGASAYDTATVKPSPNGITATGTVDYTFFQNNNCQGNGTPSGSVSLNGAGGVPNSDTQGPLAAGNYSFQATYSGDSNYAGSTGSCEPFTVAQGTSKTDTTVNDGATNAAWTGTESTGATAYDTSTVTPSAGITATGTVDYEFFTTDNCTGPSTSAGNVSLRADGSVPDSSMEGPLAAGDYSFQATYSGDSNYAGSTGACEPFSVAAGTSTTATVVNDGATNAPWTGTESTGATAYDTSTVTPSAGFTATGTVDYKLFATDNCTGPSTPAGNVSLRADGSVPDSTTTAPLAAGDYSFQATYSGDSNYAGSTGSCEPFTVAQGTSKTDTTVFDASTNAAWTGNEAPGASAYDTSKVTPSAGITATGTVTYTFFSNATCNGNGTAGGTVNLDALGNAPQSKTEGPLGSGAYSFVATYSGDSNYATSTGPCEPFAIGKVQPAVTTMATPTSVVVASTASKAVSDTATFTGGFNLTGQNADFTLYSDPTCAAASATSVTGSAAIDANGNAKFTGDASGLDAGTYYWGVSFAGDPNNNPVAECGGANGVQNEVLTITQAAPAIGTTLSSAAVNVGAAVHDTAKLTGATPAAGGTVTYSVYSDSKCSAKFADGGTVTVTRGVVPNSKAITFNTPGTYYWQASYTGDKNNRPALSTCTDEKLVVAPLIDLAITKVGSPNPATLGQGNITWTMVVTNNGPDPATGATIADPMPAGNTFVSVTTSQGSCTGGAILTCNLGNIAVHGTVTITLVTTPTTTGNQVNTVTVSGNEADTNPANNKATATVLVVGPATPPVFCVAVSKVTPKQLFVGRKTKLTIHVTQHGKAVAGIRVRIKGPKLNVTTKRSNAKGVIKQTIKMKKAGIDTFVPLASKHCNTARVGVTGVFTPPVTG